MSTPHSIKRSLSKTINAPAEKVFDSWLIPAVLGRWMVGPKAQNETIVELNNKVRPRGDFSYRVQRGNREVLLHGDYRIIDRPRRLEFGWCEDDALESVVQASFEEEAGRTRIRLTVVLPAAHAAQADSIKSQWQTRCNALAALLVK